MWKTAKYRLYPIGTADTYILGEKESKIPCPNLKYVRFKKIETRVKNLFLDQELLDSNKFWKTS